MKALEKDRTRRYETANALAMDVQRHLDNVQVRRFAQFPSSPIFQFRLIECTKCGIIHRFTVEAH